MLTEREDVELIANFQKGDQSSFEELINRYSQKVFGLASRLTKNSEDAEEVLQDVFVTVHRKIHGFEGKSSFSSWLYRVTVNTALMKIRKKKQDQGLQHLEDLLPQIQNTVNDQDDSQSGRLDQFVLRFELLEILGEAINRLPEDYRPVFVMRDIDGLSSREVGKLLNLTIPAVKSRLHRSRMILRKRLCAFYQEFKDGMPKRMTANM